MKHFLLLTLTTFVVSTWVSPTLAAVKSETTVRTFVVKHGTQTLSNHLIRPCSADNPSCNPVAIAWAACKLDARSRTQSPGSAIEWFQMRTGGGTLYGEETNQVNCETRVRETLRQQGTTRVTGSNVNTCTAATKYSVATVVAPTCVFVTAVLVNYGPNPVVVCDPAPAPQQQNCSNGHGTFTSTAVRGPAPTCALAWSQPKATDCLAPQLGRATLSWTPPTANTNGTPLTNLAGYRIQYGTSANAMTQSVQLSNPALSTHTIENLTAATWYFNIRAYTSNGTESVVSSTVSKVVR